MNVPFPKRCSSLGKLDATQTSRIWHVSMVTLGDETVTALDVPESLPFPWLRDRVAAGGGWS
jgi:hypothetical protein